MQCNVIGKLKLIFLTILKYIRIDLLFITKSTRLWLYLVYILLSDEKMLIYVYYTRTKTARIGLCVPRDASVNLKFLGLSDALWKKGTPVDSLDELDASTNPLDYFVDSEVG